MENNKIIGVAQVLEQLKQGMTREDIAAHYGITMADCKRLFMDERLKGKKTIKAPSFTLVDDVTLPRVEDEVKTTEETKEEEKVDTPDPQLGDPNVGTKTTAEDTSSPEEPKEVEKATW